MGQWPFDRRESLKPRVDHHTLATTTGNRKSFVRSVGGGNPAILAREGVSVRIGIDFTTNSLTWNLPLIPSLDITKPISFETVEFDLTVYWKGTASEIFTGLSLQPKHARYVESVINPPVASASQKNKPAKPSLYIRVTVLKTLDPNVGRC